MTSEERRQKNLQKLQEFTLMDDDFMNACFSDNLGLTEFVLRIIMKKTTCTSFMPRLRRLLRAFWGVAFGSISTPSTPSELNTILRFNRRAPTRILEERGITPAS